MQLKFPGLQKTVEVRGLKVKDINLLTDRSKMMSGESLKLILKSCVEGQSIDPESLLAGDRNALFIAARRATWGDEYDVNFTCPKCGQKGEYSIDLSLLESKPGKEEVVKKQYEDPAALHPYKLRTTKGVTLMFKLMDAADTQRQIDIQKHKSDRMATELLALKIKKIEGLGDKAPPIKAFLDDLPAVELQYFNEYYEECEPGLDSKVTVECKNGMCLAETKFDMPIEPENFFKRSAQKKH